MDLEKITDKLLERKPVLVLTTVNLLGTVFGFYYYTDQLSANPVFLWPFIPDSPIATLLISISLILFLKEKPSEVVDSLAFIGNLKYGLWTVFVLIYYSNIFYTGNPLPMYLFMLLSHIGMALQAFLILKYSDPGLRTLAVAGSWFLLNDLVDYTLGIHTRLYTSDTGPAMVAAFLLSFFSIALYLFYRYSSDELSFLDIPVNK
ncbi:MAG: DUF1405 domain-containing protein [Candidatus Nanohaloarchaea archaeon]